MSIKLSKSPLTSFEASLKSIKMYERYSFLANSSTMVDLPIRLAPSKSKAVLPLDISFHSFSLE